MRVSSGWIDVCDTALDHAGPRLGKVHRPAVFRPGTGIRRMRVEVCRHADRFVMKRGEIHVRGDEPLQGAAGLGGCLRGSLARAAVAARRNAGLRGISPAARAVGRDATLYASHTVWESEAAFRAWTTSEQFRATHRGAGGNKPLYLGHPEFEGFTSVEGV
jgi:heme-degrading monooxygenase HmoA